MINKSISLIHDSKLVHRVFSMLAYQCTIGSKFWRSFSDWPNVTWITIIEFVYHSYWLDVVSPFLSLLNWLSTRELQSREQNLWKWDDKIIHKMIEPFIEKYRPFKLNRN